MARYSSGMTVTRRTGIIVTLMAVVMALLIGGIAYASIPGPDGVIHGCRKNINGDLRAIDDTASCPSGYTALDWRDTGPVPLADHATTADTLTGLQVASASAVLTFAPGEFNGIPVSCRPGQLATGGGALLNPNPVTPTILLISTFPTLNSSAQASGWAARWRNIGTTDVDAVVTVYAICAGEVTG